LRDGEIKVDGRRKKPGDRAKGGEEISFHGFVPRAEAEIAPDPELLLRAPVLYEDDELLALDKPSGVPTLPLAHGEQGTLAGAAVARCPEIARAGPPLEGGAVHRLDGLTSGVVLFAKSPAVRERLRAAFRDGRVEKHYLALAHDPDGALVAPRIVQLALVAFGEGGSQVAAEPGEEGAFSGQAARTELDPIARKAPWVLVAAQARTGRRHQIRAHLAAIGAPIAEDPLYGGSAPRPPGLREGRLALHAVRVVLPDGRTIAAPIPPDLGAAIAALGLDR
jgi:23S rRNA pseudouridine1911/1915/1917 synthase